MNGKAITIEQAEERLTREREVLEGARAMKKMAESNVALVEEELINLRAQEDEALVRYRLAWDHVVELAPLVKEARANLAQAENNHGHMRQALERLKAGPDEAIGWPGAGARLADGIRQGLRQMKAEPAITADIDGWVAELIEGLVSDGTAQLEQLQATVEEAAATNEELEEMYKKATTDTETSSAALARIREEVAPKNEDLNRHRVTLRQADEGVRKAEDSVAQLQRAIKNAKDQASASAKRPDGQSERS